MSEEETVETRKQLATDLTTLRAELAKLRTELDGLAQREELRNLRSQASLHESEERLRLAVKAARMGIWDWDIQHDRVTISEELLELLAPTAAAPRSFKDVVAWVHPEDRERFQESVQRALERETEFALEFRLRKADGAESWVTSRAIVARDERGIPVRMIGVSVDATQRKQAEAVLAASEARYRNLVESSPDGIFVLRGQKIISVNPSGLQLLGALRREDVAGHAAVEFLPLELRDPAQKWLEHVRSTRRSARLAEARIVRLDGSLLDVEVTSAPVLEDGTPAIQVIVRDASERKRTELERRAAAEQVSRLNAELEKRVVDRTSQLQAANTELEAFSYSVSHDLRAPLRHILGFASLLQSHKEPLNPTQARHLEVIVEAAKRMGRLIDDLLSFSRMGRRELQHTRISLNLIVEEARRELSGEEAGRRVTWTIAALPEAECDPAMMRIVFVNLLGNALKYSRPRAEALIDVGCREEDREWIFFVRDNGVGFDMQYASKLFGVFQRLHGEQEFQGTGIGLASVRRIVHRHGGRTWAEGEPGGGATFYFTLPRSST